MFESAMGFTSSLVIPRAKAKQAERRIWSVELGKWIHIFTATNTTGKTDISSEALGAPLRLAYDKSGSVKFSQKGKPVIRIAKELSDSVKMVRENIVAKMVSEADKVATENAEAYNETRKACLDAGKPIKDTDKDNLVKARELRAQAEAEARAKAETEAKAQAEAQAEAKTEAITEASEIVKSKKSSGKKELVHA